MHPDTYVSGIKINQVMKAKPSHWSGRPSWQVLEPRRVTGSGEEDWNVLIWRTGLSRAHSQGPVRGHEQRGRAAGSPRGLGSHMGKVSELARGSRSPQAQD